ncbi:hypothetical protein Y032_0244g3511 [Ancylostoma ceylanicum]|uniref:G-protein coupled receptors family 1 profile domain-containing protein n=1 Tax=Ancylostoma ceylanicum TaxID=53326 RepID=A0A016SD88_9BILA|nr:hypothetical protein Y032_0244g3511 [Ancylostoma ceylanicum]
MLLLGFLQQYQLAALTVLPISFFGMVCNLFVSIFIFRLRSMANPFGRLRGSLAIAEAVHLTVFTVYFVPMVFFDLEILRIYSRYCGVILIVCFELAIYTHTLISINRFCAIYFPFQYNRIFRHNVTVVLIAITWLLAALPAIYLYGISSCRFEYFGDHWRFGFLANEGCLEIPFPTNLPTFITCTCVIIFLDFIAIYRVRVYNREIAIRQRNSCWNKARKHDEVNFLKQACLQSVLFILGIVMYFVLSYYFENPWINFCLTTVTWVSVHTFDGFITLLYNREFHALLHRKKQKS